MSVEQLELSVLQLSTEERRQFVDWMDDHRHELLPAEPDLDPDVEAEILRRRDELDAHPELLEAWAGTTETVRVRLHELRHQKIPAH